MACGTLARYTSECMMRRCFCCSISAATKVRPVAVLVGHSLVATSCLANSLGSILVAISCLAESPGAISCLFQIDHVLN
jgi:hypothetical protein